MCPSWLKLNQIFLKFTLLAHSHMHPQPPFSQNHSTTLNTFVAKCQFQHWSFTHLHTISHESWLSPWQANNHIIRVPYIHQRALKDPYMINATKAMKYWRIKANVSQMKHLQLILHESRQLSSSPTWLTTQLCFFHSIISGKRLYFNAKSECNSKHLKTFLSSLSVLQNGYLDEN